MTQTLVPYEPQQDVGLTMAVTTEVAMTRLKELQQFVKEVMVEDEDYGVIPGTNKPSLYKPGAEKLCEIYGLAPMVEVTQRVEDWDRGLFAYEVKTSLVSKRTGQVVATGVGSCNSMEGRYRWRDSQRACPKCKNETIIKGKAEYGGGWLCFAKKGGCGAKFADGDASIEGQSVGRVENDDPYTLVNTILKMAKKRSHVDATLSATRSSAIFTEDVEDMDLGGPAPTAPPERPQQAPPQGGIGGGRVPPPQGRSAPEQDPVVAEVTAFVQELGWDRDAYVLWMTKEGFTDGKKLKNGDALPTLRALAKERRDLAAKDAAEDDPAKQLGLVTEDAQATAGAPF